MKPIKIIATIILMCGISLAGCQKDDQTKLNNVTNENATNKWPTAPIIYEMTSERLATDGNFLWTEGYMTASALLFEGTLPAGNNTTSTETYATDIHSTIKLFSPVTLGKVNVQRNSYNSGSLQVLLNPQGTIAAFFLRGVYDLNGTNTAMELTVNNPVVLSTKPVDDVTISDANTYKATLYLNPGELTMGLSTDMMIHAVKTNGTIQITSSSNPDIYRIMVNNLRTTLLRVTLSYTSPLTNPVNVTAVPTNS